MDQDNKLTDENEDPDEDNIELELEPEPQSGARQKSLSLVEKDTSLTDLEDGDKDNNEDLTLPKHHQPPPPENENVRKKSGSQDSSGSFEVDLDLDSLEIPQPLVITTTTEPEPESQDGGGEVSPSTSEYLKQKSKSESYNEDDDQIVILLPPKIDEIMGEWEPGFFQGKNPEDCTDCIEQISKMRFKSAEDAREIANYIIKVIEEDLADYFNTHELPFLSMVVQQEENILKTKKYSGSNISLKEEWSDLVPGQPSTMRLYYEKGESEYRTLSMTQLPINQMVDAICEVNVHRNKSKFRRGTPLQYINGTSQTKEMTLVSDDFAEHIFRQLYPLKDDYKPPPIPTRQPSLDLTIKTAADEDPNIDKARIGPKIKWSSKQRLLPPLRENYYKIETFWTGSTFHGEYFKRQLHHGFYNYPLMATYESEFKEGHVHSRKHLGVVTYPRGDTFEGQWRKGRHISGKIKFFDDLEFEPRNWEYCKPMDRRFYIERDVGVKQAGRTLYSNRIPPPIIPPGHFDTAEGIYDPATGVLTGYNGMKIRDITIYEHHWILENCRKVKEVDERYVPSFNVDRLPCCSIDSYVRQ